MPSHDVHRQIDRLFLGKEYDHVHKWMDEPVKWLGFNHRICRHNPLILLMRFGPTDEFVSAMLHLGTDWGVTELRRKGKAVGLKKRKKRRVGRSKHVRNSRWGRSFRKRR